MMRSLSFMLLFFSIGLLDAEPSIHNEFYCFATDPIRPQTGMFATKTAYETVRGRNLSPLETNCAPRKFWMLSRGGTRLPSSSEIRRMINNHERLHAAVIRNYEAGQTTLCREDFENIQAWRFDTAITPERDSELTAVGRNEFLELARRYQSAWPTVLLSTYNQSQFEFRHTYRERTQSSLEAFAEGLFGHADVVFEDVGCDRLLRPIDECGLYEVARRNTAERDGFEEGLEFEQMLDQVNAKLGFTLTNRLSFQDVLTLWDFCRYEQGWEPDTASPWCAAFSIANHQVLDYWHDVYSYQVMGYGGPQPLFPNINCHVMQNLLTFLNSTDPNDHIARFFTSHSRIMRIFLTTLGVFRDEVPLTRHNFAQQTFRQWRSSNFAAKASNFVVVQHECADGEHELQILYNEIPLDIPGCEGRGFCRQSTFLRLFERFLTVNCLVQFCSDFIL